MKSVHILYGSLITLIPTHHYTNAILPKPSPEILTQTAIQQPKSSTPIDTTRPPLYINVNYIPNENNFILGDSALKLIFKHYYEIVKGGVKNCRKYAQQQHSAVAALLYGGAQYIADHKIATAITLSTATYFGIQIRIFYLTYQLSKPTNWSLWKDDILLEDLFSLSQQQFCSEILAEIQRRYTVAENALDTVHSITKFIKATEQEASYLKEYITIHDSLSRCRLTELSLIKKELYNSCTERLRRLAYIKGTFLGWITECRLGIRSPTMKRGY